MVDNKIGDAGMRALASAFTRGAMHRLAQVQALVTSGSFVGSIRQSDAGGMAAVPDGSTATPAPAGGVASADSSWLAGEELNLLTSGISLSENPGEPGPVWLAIEEAVGGHGSGGS